MNKINLIGILIDTETTIKVEGRSTETGGIVFVYERIQ